MSLRDVVIVGVALAMDALGVTLSIGLSNIVRKNHKIRFIISFAFFQGFLFFIGGVGGFLFEKYIILISHSIGGIIIGAVGLVMIKEGFTSDNKSNKMLLKRFTSIILGISVSIDALVVGFTAFHELSSGIGMLINSTIIGIITLIICTAGFYICRFIRKVKVFTLYSDFLGGIILIIFAIKMIFF